MDSKQLEQLLEKYWNCETSLEEEQQLREFFRNGSVPVGLKDTAELFHYFDLQKRQQVEDATFDQAVVQQIKASGPRGKQRHLYTSMARIAAGIVVVVAATYFIGQEVRKSYPKEVTDTYSDPKLAFEETKKALMMISKGFGKAQREANKIKLFHEAEQKIQGKEAHKEKAENI